MLASVQRVETSTGLYETYIISYEKPAKIYDHRERNVNVDLILTL
jgi:hypothetical protein